MADDVSTRLPGGHREPSVCIVIAARRDAPRLQRVIERLLAQRYEGTIEVLVVFDAGAGAPGVPSPPSLSGTLRRAVRTMRNTQEPGVDGARRTGRLTAEGEIVVYCRDDEEWPPDRLREVVLRRFVARGAVKAQRSAKR